MQRGSNISNNPEAIKSVPAARWMARRENLDISLVKGSGPNGIILVRDIENFKITKRVEVNTQGEKIYASSLARKLAENKGVSLEGIEGTGNRKRIMMDDVLRSIEKTALPDKEKVEEKNLFGQTVPMSQIRKVIAKRISLSAFTAPHVYFFTDIEMDKLNQLREDILPCFEKDFKVRISINDFLIKGLALTIREFPMFNATVKGEEIYINPEINIGLAVAIEEGLIVPSIPRADRLNLGEIVKTRVDLVGRARAGKLTLEELERGTFTISSLAQFEIIFFTAILNPPQVGILSIGKICDHLSLKDSQLITKKVARFGLSADHRIIDGAVAAAFLQSLKNRLENPVHTFMHF